MPNPKLPLHKFIATGGKPKNKKTMTGTVSRPGK